MDSLEVFNLDNGCMRVTITNYGCTIMSLSVPDRNGSIFLHDIPQSEQHLTTVTGTLADVVLGFESVDPYVSGKGRYFGCIVGRVANRIKQGKFKLDGNEYSLAINNTPNSLHGGAKGFDKKIWSVVDYQKGERPSITFKYHSQDGEEGYPGDLLVTATYTLTSNTAMQLDMEAEAQNKATPVSLAQHTYWNLGGHNSGSILNHTIQIYGSHITPVDETSIPTGEIVAIKGTPFDFTEEKRIGTCIGEVGIGYDHNYVLDGEESKLGLKHAAKLRDSSSGRVMNVWANSPGMQFYTGNYVNDVTGKEGALYGKHCALCLETQGFPNAVNQSNFPSVIIQPKQKYKHTMLFEFSVE